MTQQLPADCPPESAQPVNGMYFRLARRGRQIGEDGLASEDWLFPHETKKSRCFKDYARCECHAWSIFSALEPLQRAKEISPNLLRNKPVLAFGLERNMGRVKRSPDVAMGLESHCDWWPAATQGPPLSKVVCIL